MRGDQAPPLNRSAGDAAADVIRRAILDGTLNPGQKLTEEGLAGDLRISRTPIREALRVLQTEGLVVSAPHQSSTVRSYTLADLDDMYQLRALLEGHAARRAAERITSEEVDRLDESCKRLVSLAHPTPDNVHEIVEENLVFHTTILEAAGSDRLTGMVRKVIELPLVYKSYHWYSPDQKRMSEHAHEQLVRVLRAHDPERAELTMRNHIYEGRDVLIAHMQAIGGSEPVDGDAAGEESAA